MNFSLMLIFQKTEPHCAVSQNLWEGLYNHFSRVLWNCFIRSICQWIIGIRTESQIHLCLLSLLVTRDSVIEHQKLMSLLAKKRIKWEYNLLLGLLSDKTRKNRNFCSYSSDCKESLVYKEAKRITKWTRGKVLFKKK